MRNERAIHCRGCERKVVRLDHTIVVLRRQIRDPLDLHGLF